MRKIFYLIFTVTFILLLSSCKINSNTETDRVEEEKVDLIAFEQFLKENRFKKVLLEILQRIDVNPSFLSALDIEKYELNLKSEGYKKEELEETDEGVLWFNEDNIYFSLNNSKSKYKANINELENSIYGKFSSLNEVNITNIFDELLKKLSNNEEASLSHAIECYNFTISDFDIINKDTLILKNESIVKIVSNAFTSNEQEYVAKQFQILFNRMIVSLKFENNVITSIGLVYQTNKNLLLNMKYFASFKIEYFANEISRVYFAKNIFIDFNESEKTDVHYIVENNYNDEKYELDLRLNFGENEINLVINDDEIKYFRKEINDLFTEEVSIDLDIEKNILQSGNITYEKNDKSINIEFEKDEEIIISNIELDEFGNILIQK